MAASPVDEEDRNVDNNHDTPTPNLSRDNDEEDDAGEPSSIRERLQKTPSKEQFVALAKAYQDLQDEMVVLNIEKAELEGLVDELTPQRDEANAQYDLNMKKLDSVIHERDSL